MSLKYNLLKLLKIESSILTMLRVNASMCSRERKLPRVCLSHRAHYDECQNHGKKLGLSLKSNSVGKQKFVFRDCVYKLSTIYIHNAKHLCCVNNA